MKNIFKYIFISTVIVIFKKTILSFFSINEIVPDIVTIWLVYVALKEGQMSSTTAGFFSGFLLDLIGGDFIGVSALSKTICGFVAGYFFDEFKRNEIFKTFRFTFVIFLSSVVNDIFFFVIYFYRTNVDVTHIFLRYGITTTLYTTAVSLIPRIWLK